MNERIKELAEQAGYLPDMFGIGHWNSEECNKFAELIVQECILICMRDYTGIMSAPQAPWIVEQLKQHFGVEE